MPINTPSKGVNDMADAAEEEHITFAEAEADAGDGDGAQDAKLDPDDALEKAINDLQDVVDKDNEATTAGLSRTLREIPLEVQAVIGRAELSVAELNGLEKGTTIPLDSRVGDPIDIFVNGVRVATGQMQVSEEEPDRFAFKVTNVFA
ncbi:MAG: FliM/FliN family flagellar motor switch protein [Roseitalea sp.]|jgi:flagellar motor switch protein FliN/FliY|nr:FliM/FliN family flagellar motor switch protein [Roseitalea sp.]MBO6741355.1 FliM/FliN family flagellar motor switch protein [Roseitalea sp.]